MGYYVKKLPKKVSNPQWKVQYLSFKKEDTKQSRAKKPKREWDIPKHRWSLLGFNTFMTIEDAKTRAKQLNAQLYLKRQEERIKKISEQQTHESKRYDSVLPSEFVSEFEERFIRKRDSQVEQNLRKRSRAYTTWRAAQRMIVAIEVEPSEWFYNINRIYDYFYNQKMSVRYLNSVLRLANLWGFYYCRKLTRPFLPVPAPRGFERQRLIEANYDKEKGVARASKPLFPQDLAEVRNQLNSPNFNWLFISIWFGLRPKEVDGLKDLDLWKVETLPNGRKILWIFQTKIVALPPEDRWKPIPLIFSEQHFALRIIKTGNINRPLLKTMRKHFGKGVTLYGGRKGFTDLMLSKDQSFENISVWMGHSTLQRTWRSYKSRKRFHVSGY